MREIKFRAWDKEGKEIWEAEELLLLIGQDGRLWHYFDSKGKTGFDSVTDNYTIMQFTGLRDKKGVEIYEGDIVLNEHPYAGTTKDIVFYEPEVGAFSPLYKFNKSFEVIGNIYENPELIKETK